MGKIFIFKEIIEDFIMFAKLVKKQIAVCVDYREMLIRVRLTVSFAQISPRVKATNLIKTDTMINKVTEKVTLQSLLLDF